MSFHPPYKSSDWPKVEKALKQLKEIRDYRPLPNDLVFQFLYECYVLKVPREELSQLHRAPGADYSYIMRVLSPKSGEDTSRRPHCRNIFKNFMIAAGYGDPFTKYACPNEKRKKHKQTEKGLGL